MALSQLFRFEHEEEEITDLVSHVEQLMTTGGGWQDQVGAIYGGFKLTTSQPYLPLRLNVRQNDTREDVINSFEKRTFLIFTGQQVNFSESHLNFVFFI